MDTYRKNSPQRTQRTQRNNIFLSIKSSAYSVSSVVGKKDMLGIFFNLRAGMYLCLAAVVLVALPGCRGQKSSKPPVHIVQNMDYQDKYMAYGENPFFADGRNMRPLVEGTVPRDHLRADEAYYTGMSDPVDSRYIANPESLNMEFLERGRERYDIFCSVCHGLAGDGKGIMVAKGFTPAPSYYEERIMQLQDGAIFQVISNGIRTMPSMAVQVPVKDRWAVVAYVRALQRSRNATMKDVPEEKQNEIK
jgi:mono/diheme cytochrome c family protein